MSVWSAPSQQRHDVVMQDEAWSKYMKEGIVCRIAFFKGLVITVDLPASLDLLVSYTEPGVKGNTASGGKHAVFPLLVSFPKPRCGWCFCAPGYLSLRS
jgi:hypothetical protein